MVFVVQTVGQVVGDAGGNLGYSGIDHSVGIEFDSYQNSANSDPARNHIGINVGGNLTSLVTNEVTSAFDNAQIWSAWVDYNGASQLLELRLSLAVDRPANAWLSLTRDLLSDLGSSQAYVGFTASTGEAYSRHSILNWTLNDSYSPIGVPAAVPEPTLAGMSKRVRAVSKP